jgi:hypothetical protein
MTSVERSCPIHGDASARPILAADELTQEAAACAYCVSGWHDLKRLRDLGRALPWDSPEPAHAARVRSAVVASVTSSPRRPLRRRSISRAGGLIAAAALAALVVVVARPDRSTPRTAATRIPRYAGPLGDVRPVGDARYERVSAAPDEAVRLTEGRIHVAVAHLGPQERFRIFTADSSVEVRGTEFELEASAGRLQSVQVERGRVEVRVADRAAELLTAGARWNASSIEPPPAPSAAPPAPAAAAIRHVLPRHAGVPAPEYRPPPAAAPSVGASPATPTLPSTGPELAPKTERGPAPTTPRASSSAAPLAPLPATELDSRRLEREERREERREQREERRRDRLERRR